MNFLADESVNCIDTFGRPIAQPQSGNSHLCDQSACYRTATCLRCDYPGGFPYSSLWRLMPAQPAAPADAAFASYARSKLLGSVSYRLISSLPKRAITLN